GRLCAVLSGAASEGALKALDDVSGRLGPDFPALRCTVCPYPPHDAPREHLPAGAGAAEVAAQGPASAAIGPLFEQALPLWKRALDVIGAVLGLMLLAPLFAVAA